MKKYVREGRMGLPKTYKTGAVTNTYPTPMLVLNFDAGGLDVCQRRVKEVEDPCTVPSDAEVACISFTERPRGLDAGYTPVGEAQTFERFVKVVNALVAKCPWATVVLDPVTGLTDILLNHIAARDPRSLTDARAWAHKIGTKIAQTIAVLHTLPCHTVVIMHAVIDKNELTGEVYHVPMIPSSLRDRIGMLFSQFLYATFEQNKPVVYTTQRGSAKGIGCRWPADLPPVCGPTWSELYGKAFTAV